MRAILLVLILTALAGVSIAQRRGRSGLGKPAVGLALLALGISLTFALRPRPPTYLNRLEPFHHSVGYMLGRAIADRSPDIAAVIVLQDRREDATIQRLTAEQAEGLREGLGRDDSELVFVNVRDIQGESTAPPEEGLQREVVVSAQQTFKSVMDAHPEADTVVSFAGYPAYLRLLVRRDPSVRCYVWDLGINESVNWDDELARERILARVRYKPNPDLQATLSPTDSLEEIFALRYELVAAP